MVSDGNVKNEHWISGRTSDKKKRFQHQHCPWSSRSLKNHMCFFFSTRSFFYNEIYKYTSKYQRSSLKYPHFEFRWQCTVPNCIYPVGDCMIIVQTIAVSIRLDFHANSHILFILFVSPLIWNGTVRQSGWIRKIKNGKLLVFDGFELYMKCCCCAFSSIWFWCLVV